MIYLFDKILNTLYYNLINYDRYIAMLFYIQQKLNIF